MTLLRYISFFFVACLVSSCAKDDELIPEKPVARTVMVYMAANNSLAANAYANLNQMEEGFQAVDGKLVVYARIFGQQPKIYEIVHDSSPEIKSKVLKTYGDHDSSDPEMMKIIFADMKQLAAADSYAAILWSHATNWAPANLGRVGLRSFGDDNYSSMDVQQLKAALATDLDFLIFDACSMASVEVLYELRQVTPYILASPTEVLSVGMPYEQLGSLLFAADVPTSLARMAEVYVQYYQQKNGLEQSATFSLIDTRELDALAAATKQLLATYKERIPTFSRSGIQRMDLDPSSPVVAFDFQDFLDKHFIEAEQQAVTAAINRAVRYKAHTSNFLGQPINVFSGLSTYIPVREEEHLRAFYKSLAWSADAGYDNLFWWD
ncbi:clostripain-related cysteine peptidase [Sphingobacterium bambusae]|uniref:Clostripain-related cysteine peptidase n=1 Tax=Sphingobacterium bambusae TaxID=662858 RepID=A0ABW6BC95_9SPHI|nr:clostripain-related cysteine peptidase [Sphingobacterium bambusae]WPL48591.1 clostripain-related cysteine peptidase [Sphingobacterium bambusae]